MPLRIAVSRRLAAIVAAALALGSAEAGAQVRADANGPDSFTTPDYWGVSFQGGTGFIQSVSFDLTPDADAFFDFDGDATFDNATAPVLGSLVGLTAAQITASYGSFVGGDPTHPAILTFTFAPGSFGVGDAFRFGADTDFLFADPTPGGAVAAAGARFTVTFEGGGTTTAVFQRVSATESEAIVGASVVPEPSTWALLGTGLLAVGGTALRRRRATPV